MGLTPEHIVGQTMHSRSGAIANRFRYGMDYLLTQPDRDATQRGPHLFSHNRFNLMALHDSDHGGPPGKGRGADWVRQVLRNAGHEGLCEGPILLLSQPRVLGHVFNPVSFWLIQDAQDHLRAVIAEVSNTFGDRHSYLCVKPDVTPIGPDDRLTARKIFHVSPFQPVAGQYTFRFDITAQHIGIRIAYDDGSHGGLVATLSGARRPLTDASILRACLRRPFGSRRVLGLIHWQALKLWWKGANYRPRPMPPESEVSQ